MPIQTINPATNELVHDFDEFTKEESLAIVNECHQRYLSWKTTTFAERAALMKKAATNLREKAEEYAETLTLEMGKPITQAKAEVEKCADVCDYYAENAETILGKEIIDSDASSSYVRFDPIGVVLAVMPWNFPFWQVFRFAAPALMAGNVGILKHASNVPLSALAIEQVFREAGFPEYCFKTLLIGSRLVEDIVNHPYVKATTLTGSENAGRNVAGNSGRNLKKSVMELGGSDPFIVLEDADIEYASTMAVKGRLINNGQSCIAAKRFIVVEKVYDKFEQLFKQKMEAVKLGDPMDPETELGPMAREDLMLELHDQVKRSVEKGARVVTGGAPLERPGVYYPATIIADITPAIPAYHEELFGPVAILIKAKDEADAIFIANNTDFGLGSSIWTKDVEKAQKLAAEIDSGSVFINGTVKSDPRLPFGGVKISGYGRELSHYGIKEFVNIKTVWVK